jgi:NAD(P)-dependent dehydrogenase (short-subunit alcohol dehydrogenase family)
MSETAASVLITGACGDIGRALATTFAQRGARLALCDLQPEASARALVDSLEKLGAKVVYRQVNVSDESGMRAFTQFADEQLGGIDICIANAGIVERGQLVEQPLDAWRRTLDVNLTGGFITAQSAARVMIQRKTAGHILFMSSWTQDTPRKNIGAYCASKSGLKMLAKCLALELASHGIRVNLIAPGWVDAGLTGQSLQQNPERRSSINSAIPLGRLIHADELARAIALFCSSDAAYITGATFQLDGGSSLLTPGQ